MKNGKEATTNTQKTATSPEIATPIDRADDDNEEGPFSVTSDNCRQSDHNESENENVGDDDKSKWTRKAEKFRKACGDFVNNDRIQVFMVVLIVLNAMMMGIGTFDFVSENERIDLSFEYVDLIFLSIFTLELCLQLIYHGFALFKDGWLCFDFIIIVLSWSLSGFQIIRAFRVFRALRLITRVENLRNLISALLDVLPKMSAITALLLLIFYIYAVMFTVLFKDMYKRGLTKVDYFSRLDITFFTLLQIMTLDWGNLSREVMKEYQFGWVPFVTFVALTSFIVYNLIIAVVCDAVATIDYEDDEESELEPSLHRDVGDLSHSVLERLGGAGQTAFKTSERVKDLEDRLSSIATTQRSMELLLDDLLGEFGLEKDLVKGDKYKVEVDSDEE